MIAISNLQVSRGGRSTLDLPAWRVQAGAMALVTGPSGSGKTTLLHVLAGLLRPDRGSVEIDGVAIGALAEPARDAFRAGRIGVVFQTQRLMQSLTVTGNLALALRLARRSADRRRMTDVLGRLDIAHLASRRPRSLSVGEAQRAAIARAIVAGPRLLLADEPTSALDDAHAEAAIDLLCAEARACDATLVVASHDARIFERFDTRLSLERSS
ncbi:MAG: ATP-binding cassette domain-containing protein [Hyphomonadaceae bacterium]|nr:ATP-binding cassette domain-containing protein [Hyphomonadaceae bacterium]